MNFSSCLALRKKASSAQLLCASLFSLQNWRVYFDWLESSRIGFALAYKQHREVVNRITQIIKLLLVAFVSQSISVCAVWRFEFCIFSMFGILTKNKRYFWIYFDWLRSMWDSIGCILTAYRISKQKKTKIKTKNKIIQIQSKMNAFRLIRLIVHTVHKMEFFVVVGRNARFVSGFCYTHTQNKMSSALD